MKKILIALALIPITSSVALSQGAPAGNATAGKEVWDRALCKNCHGENGEGAYGPDLAGRGLTAAQFTQAVRKPWGIMPTFVETQYSNQQLADMAAYFAGMPKPAEPGKWRFEAAANAPTGQKILINVGCAQCHGPTFNGPRANLGAINADYEAFKDLVYEHTTALPKERQMLGNNNRNILMGNYNSYRVNEASLREIYNWARDDIGFRVPLTGRISKGEPVGTGMSYKIDVANGGLAGKGLTAEGVTVKVAVPAGANVMAATGAGYQGVQGNMAVWQIPSMAARDSQSLSITLSKAGTEQDNLKGEIRWAKPAPKTGPNNDVVNIAPAPL